MTTSFCLKCPDNPRMLEKPDSMTLECPVCGSVLSEEKVFKLAWKRELAEEKMEKRQKQLGNALNFFKYNIERGNL